MSEKELHEKDTKPTKKRSLAKSSSASETVAILGVGQLLSGRYKIIERIGAGGMGVVYRVEDIKWDNRTFALKALPPDMAKSSAAIKRLKREADSAIDLRHPNIMALHSFDNDGPHHFLLMEYLDGPDLEDALADKERFSLDEVLEIARQVCPALEHAHERGVIHRDVKPGNLLYKKEGDKQIVKIADFGIAYQVRDSLARITGQDTTGGTMHYMPPEQLAGYETDARSDQYALAATIYELLRGRTPFQGAGGVLMRQIEEKEASPIADVPEQINAALLKALSKKPEDRFQSCSEFLDALEGRIEVATRTTAKAEGMSSIKHQALIAVAACVLVFGLLGFAEYSYAIFGLFGDSEFQQPPATSLVVPASPTVSAATIAPIAATSSSTPTPQPTKDTKAAVVAPTTASSRFGKAHVCSEPTGAKIILDGQDTNKVTNAVLHNLSLGEHKLIIKKEGFKERALSLNITNDELKRLEVVKLVTNWGRLRVEGSPKNATFRLLPVEHESNPTANYKFGEISDKVLSGRYLIEAKAPFHKLVTQDVSIPEAGKTTTVNIQLKPIRAELSIASNPTGATITINGVKHDTLTPAKVNLPCGTHRVKLANGYYTWDGNIELVEKGTSKTIEMSVDSIPITFSSAPAGAKVFCYGRTPVLVGKTIAPFTKTFKPGKYRFKFANLSGYREMEVPFEVRVGGSQKVHANLQKEQGFIKPNVYPFDAHVTINGHHYTGKQIALSPGRYTVKAAANGFDTQSKYVTVTNGKIETVTIYLREKAKPKKQEPRPGEEKTIAGIRFCWCPPGEFMMGSPYGEPGRDSWEGPQHRVLITKGFWLGKFEVTIAQWQNVMGRNPARFVGSNRPVEQITWFDCENFIQRLNQREGGKYKFRLPTEAEWEYGCRAGTTTALYTGSIRILGQNNAPALDVIGWYGGNCGTGDSRDFDSRRWPQKQYNHGRAGTHPVGQKRPNAWGLHDMIGNVYEWCSDWFTENYYSSSPLEDPTGPYSGSRRVHRGSSWSGAAKGSRSASRAFNPPNSRFHDLGLRLLLEE